MEKMGKRLPSNLYWHPGKKTLVRVNGALVSKAQDCEYTIWGTDDYVDSQEFIVMAGAEVLRLAGLLGLGVGYLVASANRMPRPGYTTRVIPNSGKAYTGAWEGIDACTGHMRVGGREYDPDRLAMVGPVRRLEDGRSFLDLNNGWVSPDELAKLKKAHDRNGFKRRRNARKH